MLRSILKFNFLPSSTDAGLLVLRVGVCLILFIKHGYGKIFDFSQMAHHFPDPFHIGMTASLIIAMISDGICSLLIVVGLATRWASLYAFVNILVAWVFVHHFLFLGNQADHGELVLLFVVVMAAIFIAGPGRYSVDHLLKC